MNNAEIIGMTDKLIKTFNEDCKIIEGFEERFDKGEEELISLEDEE